MAVVAVDAAVLDAGPPALDAALTALLDGATCVRFEGTWPRDPPAGTAATLSALSALTLGVGAVSKALEDALDLVVADRESASRVAAAFSRAPFAAVSAALLLRQAPDTLAAGLVAESTTYSMLQAGPEFAAWRTSRHPTASTDGRVPRVRVDDHGSVISIVLTRAEKHNALDVAMRDQLHAALTEARWRGKPVAVTAEGPSFCSGGDLDEFATFPDPVRAHLVRLERSLAACFAALADRLVVGIHGACLGAGIELPAFAGRIVAAGDARIGLPEQGMGLVPGAGGTVSITRRAGRHSTLALLLRDGTITAAEARSWGLVDEVVPAERVRARVLEIAESLV